MSGLVAVSATGSMSPASLLSSAWRMRPAHSFGLSPTFSPSSKQPVDSAGGIDGVEPMRTSMSDDRSVRPSPGGLVIEIGCAGSASSAQLLCE